MAKTHYTEKEARDLVKMFLETMAYMHEAGVVHRDLKPENLLLCSGDRTDTDVCNNLYWIFLTCSYLVPLLSLPNIPHVISQRRMIRT